MNTKLSDLEQRLREIGDLRSASYLLEWDQSTYMPEGGETARGRQLSLLTRLAHERATDAGLGKLISELEPDVSSWAHDSVEASLLRVARRDYDRALRVPPSFAAKLSDHLSATYNVWKRARPADDFAKVQPYLEKTLDLSRELAAFFPRREHLADPLIDAQDQGMTVATVRTLFGELRKQLVPLVEAITSRPQADDSCLRGPFAEDAQLRFGDEVVRAIGFDFGRGRLDKTHHPFMTRFALGDVRITTRVNEHDLGDCLFSMIHEAGHAMYEQGTAPELDGLPLGEGASAGVHESQSRLWENLVGRSRPFWTAFYPRLQAAFPSFQGVPMETFYRAINRVERTLIRTDADEVTYNLHVMIRFDLEMDLLEGRLAVKDLPEAWRERYRQDLGISPLTDKDGVLQDVHWYAGTIGGLFQGYTLGNVFAAQIFETAVTQVPGIPGEIASGKFDSLRTWLTQNLYQHGRKYAAPDVMERSTGKPLTIEPYVRYLKGKYGELYGI